MALRMIYQVRTVEVSLETTKCHYYICWLHIIGNEFQRVDAHAAQKKDYIKCLESN